MHEYYKHRDSLNLDLVSEIVILPNKHNIENKINKVNQFIDFLNKERDILQKILSENSHNPDIVLSFLKINIASFNASCELLETLNEYKIDFFQNH